MYREFIRLLKRYQTTILSIVALCAFGALVVWIDYVFISALIEKGRTTRSELLERDLRELVGRFDADERSILNANVQSFVAPTRPLNPLLLPRQYYAALPSGNNTFVPRPPPRNCFVGLVQTEGRPRTAPDDQEAFCAYFIEKRTPGSYLFASVLLLDRDVVTLQQGDIALAADLVRLKATSDRGQISWIIALQNPRGQTVKGRYELTAFHEVAPGQLELDRRVEGWAFEKPQPSGAHLISLSMRIDVRAILGNISVSGAEEPWPPLGWNSIKFQVDRKDVSSSDKKGQWRSYLPTGPASLSLPSLAESIFDAGADLRVIVANADKPQTRLKVGSSKPSDVTPEEPKAIGITAANDLIIFSKMPLVKSLALPDTAISFEVRYPGTIIDNGIWQSAAALAVFSLCFVLLFLYLLRRLLVPILRLTHAVQGLIGNSRGHHILPFTHREDEIGSLAGAFNGLLDRLRSQQAQELATRERRAEELERKQLEEAHRRASNLKIIGHEIRAPLQALMSLNQTGSPSRRYIERIYSAVVNLFGGVAIDAAFDARPLKLERLDLSVFLHEIAANSPLGGIPQVQIDGPETGISVMAEPMALEDVITNILGNANRYRPEGTPIIVRVSRDDNYAYAEVFNFGNPIPADMLNEIFDLHFSTKKEAADEAGRIDHGIGLYVARSYVTKMSGEIRAENRPDGVAFVIDLPLAALELAKK